VRFFYNNKNSASGTLLCTGILAATMIVGCVAEEESAKQVDDILGLELSLSDYRFGVQDVGSETAQMFELKNVGVDTYPINSVTITGDNAEDFAVDVQEGITLEPGDKMDLKVAFVPVGEGQRVGSLDIDYNIIEGLGSNLVEARYYEARDLEDAGDNVAAAAEYRDYLNEGSTTDNKARAMIKLSLLEEADVYGIGKDFNLYKSALNLRDDGDIDGSVAALNSLITDYEDSYLVDDAAYMLGYIQLVDQSNYEQSIESMQLLIDQYPDSNYYDTALYSQGIAEYELGNIERAEEIFLSLRERHTGVQLGLFEMRWPKDNYVSRLWFDKADEQLATIEGEQSDS
jgi:TolA-binding protein